MSQYMEVLDFLSRVEQLWESALCVDCLEDEASDEVSIIAGLGLGASKKWPLE